MKYFIVGLFLIPIFLFSCDKDHCPDDNEWSEGVLHFTGDVTVDGCGWLLLTEGGSYHLSNLEEKFKHDGLEVLFKGSDLDETFSCGLSQTMYKVKKIDDMIEKPWKVKFLSDYPGRELSMDMYSLDSVQLVGDSLKLHVGYSGGCGIHQFNLWVMDTGSESDGKPQLMLEHIGNGDPCEAYLGEWLSFSLKPLQIYDSHEVEFWLRGNPLMSAFYGSYVYIF